MTAPDWLKGSTVEVKVNDETRPGIIRDVNQPVPDHTRVIVELDDGHELNTAGERVDLL